MISRPLRRGRRFAACAVLSAVALAVAPMAQAAIVSSTFDVDDEGWIGWICPNPGLCALGAEQVAVEHLTIDGDGPGGIDGPYIRTRDPSGETAARMEPPAKFRDRYAIGQTLIFDALAEDNGGGGGFDSPDAPLVTIEGAGGATLVFGTSDLPEINVWKRYQVPLFEAPGWLIFDGALRPLAAGEFAAVFNTMTRLTIIGEWLSDEPELDTGGLDNVHLVPVPAALPLLLSAVAGFSFVARRRRAGRVAA